MRILIWYLILLFDLGQPGFMQHPGDQGSWTVVGTTQAKFTADHDGIAVQRAFNNFTRVKFKVTSASLSIVKMVVTYNSGLPDNIEMLFDIPEGGESKVIDIRGVGERKIKRIDFWYDTKGVTKGAANVTIYAMK